MEIAFDDYLMNRFTKSKRELALEIELGFTASVMAQVQNEYFDALVEVRLICELMSLFFV